MAIISTANFLIETKRIAAMIDLIETAYGDGDDTNTPSKGAANAKAAIEALGDSDQLTALLPEAVRFADRMKYENQYNDLTDWLRAFDQHVNGLNDYLSDNSLHIHYHLRKVDPVILPRWVFPPVTELANASYNGSWSDTGEVNTINTNEYGDALIEFHTTAAIGVADIDVTIYGENYDGESVQTSGTIPASTGNDTVVAIAGSVRFVKITSMDVTGGTTSDSFRVDTKFDRDPTGCA